MPVAKPAYVRIRLTNAELHQLQSMGRADAAAQQILRAELAKLRQLQAPTGDESATTGDTVPEDTQNAIEDTPATANEFVPPNAVPTTTGLTREFMYWLENNCHNAVVLQLVRAVQAFNKGESLPAERR